MVPSRGRYGHRQPKSREVGHVTERFRTGADDRWLIAETARRNRAAGGELLRRYSGLISKICRAYCHRDDVDDARQQAATDIFLGAKTFRGDSTVGAWIAVVTRNAAIKVSRKASGRASPTAPEDIQDPSARQVDGRPTTLSSHAEGVEDRETLRALLAQLPDDTRAMLWLMYVEGWSRRQVADFMHVSDETVKTRLANAKAALRKHDWDGKK